MERQYNSSTKSRRLKHICTEWCKNSTSHGVPNIVRTDLLCVRIMWIVAFTAGTAYCCYITVKSLTDFFEYSVLDNNLIVHQIPIPFPAITICNLNPFDMKKLPADFRNQTLTRIGYNPRWPQSFTSSMNVIREVMATNTTQNASVGRYYGFDLRNMLISCTFVNTECNSVNFTWIYSHNYGNCYTFNSGFDNESRAISVQEVRDSGMNNGLNLELFIGEPEEYDLYSFNRGMYLIIHNQTYTPVFSNEGLYLAAGFQTNIGIKRTFKYSLDKPYSNCIKDVDSIDGYDSYYFKAMFREMNVQKYRRKQCYQLCQQDFILEACGCLNPQFPILEKNKDEMLCNQNKAMIVCAKSNLTNFPHSYRYTECLTDCPTECDTITYSIETSNADFPSDDYVRSLKMNGARNPEMKFNPNLTLDMMKQSVLFVKIYYADLAFDSITQIPQITLDQLLGTIGGQLGLFIGISFLSLLEIVEIIIEVLYHVCFTKVRVSKSQRPIQTNY